MTKTVVNTGVENEWKKEGGCMREADREGVTLWHGTAVFKSSFGTISVLSVLSAIPYFQRTTDSK